MFQVTKTYGHDLGLSACFRQPLATSHCRFLHGYALSFKFTFESEMLCPNNWVIDFGSLKPLKQWLVDTFDHKMLLTEDDPHLDTLSALAGLGLADPIILPYVGCEAFAELAFEQADTMLRSSRADEMIYRKLRVAEVEVREHGANSAIYKG